MAAQARCAFLAVLWLCYSVQCVTSWHLKSDCPCSDPSLCDSVTAPPRKEIFAFSYEAIHWAKYDWSKITTIAMTGEYLPEIMCHAHSVGARAVVKGIFPAANLSNAEDRTAWITQQVARTHSLYLDGINFDIEYALEEKDAHYLVALVNETTTAFHKANPHWQVTFDTFPYPGCPAGRCYDYTSLASSCDFIVLMEYNMGGLGPIAKSNDPMKLVKVAVESFIVDGIPADKLVLAVPWYGYSWTCTHILQDNICSVLNDATRYGGVMTYLYFSQITDLLKNSTTGRLYNETFQSPFFNYKDEGTGKIRQVWYDDAFSLSLRYQYAKSQNLRGVGMWNADCLDYSGDDEGTRLTKEMWDAIDRFKA
ncbi:di-N-acetylchitobiase-like [Asterias rubens]|uniref:di-N-acetylchitobiase-like n=1 Tax=Asterias rubens TaxID=7604 RepID=UPI00145595B5|nr:di-N-acetylchitobiase-like [Asterias rubens]